MCWTNDSLVSKFPYWFQINLRCLQEFPFVLLKLIRSHIFITFSNVSSCNKAPALYIHTVAFLFYTVIFSNESNQSFLCSNPFRCMYGGKNFQKMLMHFTSNVCAEHQCQIRFCPHYWEVCKWAFSERLQKQRVAWSGDSNQMTVGRGTCQITKSNRTSS